MKKIPVIEFEKVSRVYGDPNNPDTQVTALSEASFVVYSGEFVAITGPSGSGKSTVLNLVGLLDRPSSGHILVDGEDTVTFSDDRLAEFRNRKIGFVFQQFNLLPRTPAIVNVELPLVYQGVSKKDREQRATAQLTQVGLGDKLKNRQSQLSGGQQQRVAIARALVTNPSLLLADEPTGNLDSKTGTQILQLFKDLHKQGITIIMVTHDGEIAKQAERIIMVKDGRIV